MAYKSRGSMEVTCIASSALLCQVCSHSRGYGDQQEQHCREASHPL